VRYGRVLWDCIRAHPWLYAANVTTSVLFYLFNLAPGLAIREFFNAITNSLFGPAMIALGAVVGLRILHALTGTCRMIGDTTFRHRTYTRIRINVMEGILNTPCGRGTGVSTGDLLARLSGDAVDVPEFLGKRGVLNFLPSLLAAGIAIVTLAQISPLVCLIAVGPAVVVGVITIVVGERVKHLRSQARATSSVVSGVMRELFRGVEALKAAVAVDHMVRRVGKANHDRRRAEVRDAGFGGVVTALQESVVIIGTALAALGLAAFAPHAGLGDFALFVYNLTVIGTTVANGGQFWNQVHRIQVAVRRLEEVADASGVAAVAAPRQAATPTRTGMPDSALERLRITGIEYRRADDTRYLAPADLTIDRGECVVVTGPVGSGKTTFVQCLVGLLPRTGGSVQWNDQEIPPDMRLGPPRVAYVPQGPHAVQGTIRENILRGADDNHLNDAIKAAALVSGTDGISLDDRVGTHGHGLSGGQLQRLCLARALTTDPDLLIIDDITAALDATTEQRILDRVITRRGKRSLLIVSNSPEVIARADKLIKL